MKLKRFGLDVLANLAGNVLVAEYILLKGKRMKNFFDVYKKNEYTYYDDLYIFDTNDEIIEYFKRKNIYFNFSKYKVMYVYKDSIIEPNVKFYGGDRITSFGAFSYSNCNMSYGVQLGRYCSIAAGFKIFGAEHFTDWISTSPSFYSNLYQSTYINSSISHKYRTKHRVNIGNDVWIGRDVTVKSDISIGDGAVIATGAVVTKDVEPFSIIGGVPAKLIRYRFKKDIINSILQLKWWKYKTNDLQNMDIDKPRLFLSKLYNKIQKNEIQEYNPEYVTVESIKKHAFFYKQFVSKIENKYKYLEYSRDYSRNYYQIYIDSINKKIHYEILKMEKDVYLCLDFEDKKYCTEDTKLFAKKITNNISCFSMFNSTSKICIKSLIKDNFDELFCKLYNLTIEFICSNYKN